MNWRGKLCVKCWNLILKCSSYLCCTCALGVKGSDLDIWLGEHLKNLTLVLEPHYLTPASWDLLFHSHSTLRVKFVKRLF